jgi:hypothetical protein
MFQIAAIDCDKLLGKFFVRFTKLFIYGENIRGTALINFLNISFNTHYFS